MKSKSVKQVRDSRYMCLHHTMYVCTLPEDGQGDGKIHLEFTNQSLRSARPSARPKLEL